MKQKKEEISSMSQKERYAFRRSVMVGKTVTNASIARKAKCSREFVYQVLTDQKKGYRIRNLVAAECGVAVEYLFPDTPPSQRKAA